MNKCCIHFSSLVHYHITTTSQVFLAYCGIIYYHTLNKICVKVFESSIEPVLSLFLFAKSSMSSCKGIIKREGIINMQFTIKMCYNIDNIPYINPIYIQYIPVCSVVCCVLSS